MTNEEKIKQNEQEDKNFVKQLDKYLKEPNNYSKTLNLGKTTFALSLAGSNEEIDITIKPSTIKKCMGSIGTVYHAHDLDRNIMIEIPKQLRNPLMLFQSDTENSIVAITELKDKQNRGIMVAIELDKAEGWVTVNRIKSVYGRNNFVNYIDKQIKKGHLLAYNKEKANKLLHSIGLQSPKENTIISYDDSIAYTKENVKYPKKENERKDVIMNLKIPDSLRDEIHTSAEKRLEMLPNIKFDREIENTQTQELSRINQKTAEKAEVKETENRELEEAAEKLNEAANDIIQAQKYEHLAQANAEIVSDIDNGSIAKYFEEENLPTENNDIISVLHSLADKEDASAMNMLAVCYIEGLNVFPDEEKAMEYLQKAADNDFAPAQRNLAIMLEKAENPDKEKITDLYVKAADKGDAYAQNNLGVCYMTGDGVKKDVRKAIQQFEKAVKSGDDFAMVNLADCYSIGNGVRKNDKQAFDLYKQAADKGNIAALKSTADCFYNGIGIKQNFEQAMIYYKMAADKGDVSAQQSYDKLKDKVSMQKHQQVEANKKEKEKPQKSDKVKEKTSHDER